MNINKRLEKLETTAKVQVDKIDIIRIIIERNGTISGAIRRDASGKYVSVSDEELKEIRAIN